MQTVRSFVGMDVHKESISISVAEDCRLLRPVFKSGKILRDELGDWAIWSVVEQASKQIGIEHFGAHDLRRTCAKLCRKNGGDLEQIKFFARALVDTDHGAVSGIGAGDRNRRE